MKASTFNVLHDIFLTSFGYLPYWKKFNFIESARDDNIIEHMTIFYNNMKTLTLPDGYTWGSFMPASTPDDLAAWQNWQDEAISFANNISGYIAFHDPHPTSDWTNANIDNSATTLLPQWHRQIAESMNLCPLYDSGWPKVMDQYKSMPKLDASYCEGVYERYRETQGNTVDMPPFEWLEE